MLSVRGSPGHDRLMSRTLDTLARIPMFRSLGEDAVRRLDAGCI